MFDFQQDGGLRILPGREGASWQVTLRLGGPAARDAGGWTADGTRAEYPRPGITEWYQNRPEGLEHGFTVHQRPATAGKQGYEIPVVLGGLAVEKDPYRPGDLRFTDPASGVPVLGYQGLKVWDATGRALNAEMFPHGAGFHIAVNDVAAVYPVTIDPLIVSLEQTIGAPPGGAITYVKASNTELGDVFGLSVAIDGTTLVVGAIGENSAATGINGADTDNSTRDSGAAYVFVRDGSTWSQQAYLKASNGGEDDYFGISVAISGDTIVVGAYLEDSAATGTNGSQSNNSALDSGAAYVFVRSGATWSQQAYLKASNTGARDDFGARVAISGDTIVVGALGEDSAATGINANQSDNSALDSGAAYVFVRSGTTWSQQAYLKASNTGANDFFGSSVAISGNTLVVGASAEASAATGINGSQSDNGANDSGAAYVFVRSGTTWSQQAYLKASNTGANDFFGYSVAISGNTLVVGASAEASAATGINGNQSNNSAGLSGAAYVFVRSGSTWSQQAYLKASNTGANDQFGTSVAISGDTIVVGARSEASAATGINGNQGDNSAGASGAAYVYVRTGTTWSQQVYLKASNRGAGDWFGYSVAIFGGAIVVGARSEDSAATGINGNQSDNSAGDSGAAYIFHSSGAAANDHFGLSAAIDGDVAVVGAPDHDHLGMLSSGKVWIFRRSGTSWALEDERIIDEPAPGDRFGIAVAVSGNWLAVGANGDDVGGKVDCGSVSTYYDQGNGIWENRGGKLSPAPSGSRLGRSVDLDGTNLVAGAPRANGSGEVWTWDDLSTAVPWSWRPTGSVTAATPQLDADFGHSVALSGERLVVGEPGRNANVLGVIRSNAGAVGFFRKRFTRATGTWDWPLVSSFNYTVANQGVGFSVAIDGDVAVAGNASPAGWFTGSGTSHVGSAFVYTFDGTIWTSAGALDASGLATGSYFGSAVAVENGVIAVGAFGNGVLTGRVRLFQQQGNSWVTQQTLSHPSGESNNAFGRSLGLSNGNLLVGAYGADTGLIDVGQAYVYQVVDPDAVVPPLVITRSGGNVILSWPPTPGWSLWASPSLGTGSWNPVTVVTDGSHTHPVSAAPRMFFRLQN
jgi:hypothetical protein